MTWNKGINKLLVAFSEIKKKYSFAKIIKGSYIPSNINFLISGSNTTASYFSIYNNF